MNLLNINPNYNFLRSLGLFISQNFTNLESDILLILPSKKSCAEFKKIYKSLFQDKKEPKIVAISQISPFHLKFISKNAKIEQETYDIFNKQPSDLKYIFELARKIRSNAFFKNVDTTNSINIATSLKSLFDDLSKADISINDLEIEDHNISSHRQFAINIIKDFYIDFNSKSTKSQLFSSSDIQKLKIKHLTDLVAKYGFDKKVIIAGSTGSVEYVRDFMKIIASNENGYIITNGIYQRSKDINPKDPAYLFNDLFSHLGGEKEDVKSLEFSEAKITENHRFNFLASHILSSEVKKIPEIDLNKIKQDLENNFQIFKAKNQIDEVNSIAKYLSRQDLGSKKTAIICPNVNLMILLKSYLKKNNLQFNDYEKSSLIDLKFTKLFLLVANALQNDLDSVSILSLLKSNLVIDQENLNSTYQLEKQIIRSYKSSNDIEDLLKTIQENTDFDFVAQFLNELIQIKQNLKRLNISEVFQQISDFICKYSNKELTDYFDSDQLEKFNQTANSLKENDDLKINKNEIREFFNRIFAFANFSKDIKEDCSIEISNTIESRLINYDLVIFVGLNKSNYPALEKDSWLSGKIRKELNIFNNDKKTSLAAYDFCNLLCNKQVILSYSDFVNSSKAQKSPFLVKLETILHENNIILTSNLFFMDDLERSSQGKIVKQSPKIKLQYYLKTFSATDIELISQNPYSFYAKRILQLKPEKEIDQEPTNADFGTFMHKLVEICAKENLDEESSQKKLNSLFFTFFKCDEARLTFLPKAHKILQNFLKDNQDFLDVGHDSYEKKLFKKITNDFSINAKIDRIHIDQEGRSTIIDYKTGSIPSIKQVRAHQKPQLLIYALLNGLEGDADSIKYWKLGTNEDESIKNILSGENLAQEIEKMNSNLTKLMNYFSENSVSFRAIDNDNKYDDYRHLSRCSAA